MRPDTIQQVWQWIRDEVFFMLQLPKKKKVLGYRIKFVDGKAKVAGDPFSVVEDVETHWLACDGLGSLFFTDEVGGNILKVHVQDLLDISAKLSGKLSAKVIYSSSSLSKVSSPGGVAVDNFHVYWGNKAIGTQAGSVVQGFELPRTQDDSESVHAIADNVETVHGVCLVEDNVFFSAQEKVLYAVDKTGAEPATEVHTGFHSPRGCS